jgi:hypothetical protein
MPHLPQSNFHQTILSQFGRTTLKIFRFLERKTSQQAKGANHQHFNLHCKYHQVTPRNIRIQSTVKGAKADAILKKAVRAFLVENNNNATKHKVTQARRRLQITTDPPTFDAICDRLKRTYTNLYNKTRQRQQCKFQRMQHKQQ